MSSVQVLRKFINERLTAAAVEIFKVVERTIVQYEEEIDRQRRLLDISWKPQRTDLPQQYVYEEERRFQGVFSEQQLHDQGRNCSLDQEEPESSLIKEEKEDLCVSEKEEQLVMKKETDNFMMPLTSEESDHSEPESDTEQLLYHIAPAAEAQDQRESVHIDSASSRNSELLPTKRQCKYGIESNNVDNCPMSQCVAHTAKKSVMCDFCGKTFQYQSQLKKHQRIHTGEKPYSCERCGKCFRTNAHLLLHIRTHTGEKPYLCKICGKRYISASHLKSHMNVHTGERPYSCEICGKRFFQPSNLKIHVRTHTGEKPYFCETCGKRFNDPSAFKRHMTIHTGKEQQSFELNGESFTHDSLFYHMSADENLS